MLKQLGNSWALANRPKAAGSFGKGKSEKAVTEGRRCHRRVGLKVGKKIWKKGAKGEQTSKVGNGLEEGRRH